MKTILTFFLVSLFGISVQAQKIFVRAGAQGDGSSWFYAFSDLQEAIDSAFYGDEIWVAAGTYYPTKCATCGLLERNTSFVLKNGVHLFGGFGGWENSRSERKLDINETILSGDIDQDGTNTLNSFNVIYATAIKDSTVLDGFIIQDGHANQMNIPGNKENCGGGIYLDAQLSGGKINLVINNCVFRNNAAINFGGAAYVDASFSGVANLTLANCSWMDNHSEESGGAIYFNADFEGAIEVSFFQGTFERNVAKGGHGGAIFTDGTENGQVTLVIDDIDFRNNSGLDGGAIHNQGKRGNCTATIRHSEFILNSSGAIGGGAIYNDGSFQGYCHTDVFDCHFEENYSEGDGGAIYNLGSEGQNFSAKISKSSFINNSCMNSGAAIFNNGYHGKCNPEITNSIFENNHTINYGGAIYNLGNEGICNPSILNCAFLKNSAYSAGAIYNLGSNAGESSPLIINSTFYGNKAQVGGAIYCNAKDVFGNSSAEIVNCIFYKNFAPTGQVFRNIFGSPNISYSLVDLPDCSAFQSGDGANMICTGPIIFNEDPLFQDTINGDFRLSALSPAVDFGNTQLTNTLGILIDLNDLNRVFGAEVDIGAYEYGSSSYFNITEQPQSQELCEGNSLHLRVEISPTVAALFQWEKNGIPLSGKNSHELNISSVNVSNSGNYSCEITFYGVVLKSEIAEVEVRANLEVEANWMSGDTMVCEGSDITIQTSVVHGGPNPTFSWYLNDALLPDETNANWSSDSLTPGANTISYSVISSERCLLNETAHALPLNIFVDTMQTPVVQISGLDSVVCEGDTVIVTAQTQFGGTQPMYEWYLNDEILSIVDSFLIIDSLKNEDLLHCEMISNKNCIVRNRVQSNKLKAFVETCITGTRKTNYSAEFLGYPNPVDDIYYVTFPTNLDEIDVKIVDIFGNTVYSMQFKELDRSAFSLDCKGLPTGFYSVFLMGKFSRGVLSFVKSN